MQQVGNCVGVALIGPVYFRPSAGGSGVSGSGAAFATSLLCLSAVMGVLAVLGAAPTGGRSRIVREPANG
ncbi:MAG: hypothetical protein L0H79_21580 [Intrasporangium sp.]|uniref:hypothetical protein n=1 Tax=Intrasporangium sp. TaxID=1925024 RepID=UPI002648CEDA|nr:hypothetical protein [Intrasporangium sp.]MDN5798320.1 hypothetical protein [Intrasporangium sp.]